MNWQRLIEIVQSETATPVSQGSVFADLDMDSLDYLDMILEVEKAFNVTIPEDGLVFPTVQDLGAWLQEHAA